LSTGRGILWSWAQKALPSFWSESSSDIGTSELLNIAVASNSRIRFSVCFMVSKSLSRVSLSRKDVGNVQTVRQLSGLCTIPKCQLSQQFFPNLNRNASVLPLNSRL